MEQLELLYNSGRYAELESRARLLTEQYPNISLTWEVLSAALQMQGKDALAIFQKITELEPNNAEAHSNLGNAQQSLGRLNHAAASFQRALEIKPDSAEVHCNLGVVLHAIGHFDDAVASFQRALKIKPDFTEAHCNLAVVLHILGRLDDAAASIHRALEINSDHAEAHNNLGVILRDLGQQDGAAMSFQQALRINSDFAEAHNNLGQIQIKRGQLDDAVASCRRALQLNPNLAEAHTNLGNALKALGQHDNAVASYRQALQINPNFAEAHNNLGNTLQALRQYNHAVSSYRRALQINPNYTEALSNLGSALQALGQHDNAVASYRQALEIKPDFAEAHSNFANALQARGQHDKAVTSYRRALQINPDLTETHNNLGISLLDLGQLNDAAESYRRALEINPDLASTFSNLLFCLIHSVEDAQFLLAEHHRFAEQFESRLRADWPQHTNSRNPERRLQVGFVSGDLNNHAVASFIEPVLAHLAGSPQLSLHGYYNHFVEDSTTQRLRKHLKSWHPIVDLTDHALAQKIREDGIDILIDLSGHTAKNRLLTFARKPAPIQASWMGYPGSTGLSAMDYYLADRHFLPPGLFDEQFTEKIVRLPASSPFLPSNSAPPVNTLPALHNKYITFGSFNRLNKISRAVVSLWAQLLRALPNSKILLGAMPDAGQYDFLIDWFSQESVAQERLIFYPRSSLEDYLSLHHQVDICLDTFPYSSGTTSCHALWMGVPTLTMTGNTPVSWVGATLPSHVRLESFITHNKLEFVEKGLYWADNLSELAEIRDGLRVRFAQSAVGQPQVIATALERALRTMWQRWCAGLPAESFEESSNR